MKAGKIPAKILEATVFRHLGARREDIVLGPRVGEDAAIVKVNGQLISFSCDPVSGAVRKLGWISVNICCNDISTRGVRPRWFLSCIMLPETVKNRSLKEICRQMDAAALNLDVSIIGGHSEYTPGLTHPVIVGFAAGLVEGKFVTTSGARPGDKILLTKSAGIEGTAILASDRREALAKKLGEQLVDKASRFIDKISVVDEALTAYKCGGVHAMHDPTEGGLAGGLYELADASAVGFQVYREAILVEPETLAICRVFNIDFMSLMSSGSLLIAVDPDYTDKISGCLIRKGIPASIIGEVTENTDFRVSITEKGSSKHLRAPCQDELWTALRKNI